jgi:hypothetical protein
MLKGKSMNATVANGFQKLLPAWFVAVLAPAPAIIVAKSGTAGLMYFFVACASLVAYSFRDAIDGKPNPNEAARRWHRQMASTAVALVAAWLFFATFCMILGPPHQFVAAWLGLMILAPCLGIVPYLVLSTRQPFAAVVFTMTLVACVKLAGCVVVVAVYGWNANEFGHTDMPWTRPNLLVWCFFIGTAILSTTFYVLGARKWQSAGSVVERKPSS